MVNPRVLYVAYTATPYGELNDLVQGCYGVPRDKVIGKGVRVRGQNCRLGWQVWEDMGHRYWNWTGSEKMGMWSDILEVSV